MFLFFAYLNTTLRLKTATDSSGPKAGNLSTKIQFPWHHSEDAKHYFYHDKFEVRLVMSFKRKSMPKQK
jgi:hypothetical protein